MAITEVFTGERFVPDCTGEIWAEHWHRYLFARRFVAGMTVLDAACGEGYGAAWLAGTAKGVSALDVDVATIDSARAKYPLPNLRFDVGSVAAMPYADASFDCAISFETLEHLAEQEEMLREFRRVLRPDGILIISTPNKSEYSDKRHFQNAFHVRELYAEEFRALVGRHFGAQRWQGQKLTFNSALWPLPARQDIPPPCEWIRLDEHDNAGTEPMYFIAFAAARESLLPTMETMTLLSDPTESMYNEYVNTVSRMAALERLVSERERVVIERDAELAAMASRATIMETLIVERERVVVERDAQLAGRAAQIASMEKLIAERDAQLLATNGRIAKIEELLSYRERIIVERDRQLEEVNARIALAERLIAERERIIVERDAQIAGLQTEHAALEAEIKRRGGIRFWLASPFIQLRRLFSDRGTLPHQGKP